MPDRLAANPETVGTPTRHDTSLISRAASTSVHLTPQRRAVHAATVDMLVLGVKGDHSLLDDSQLAGKTEISPTDSLLVHPGPYSILAPDAPYQPRTDMDCGTPAPCDALSITFDASVGNLSNPYGCCSHLCMGQPRKCKTSGNG